MTIDTVPLHECSPTLAYNSINNEIRRPKCNESEQQWHQSVWNIGGTIPSPPLLSPFYGER
jgi:hypothetical protein